MSEFFKNETVKNTMEQKISEGISCREGEGKVGMETFLEPLSWRKKTPLEVLYNLASIQT